MRLIASLTIATAVAAGLLAAPAAAQTPPDTTVGTTDGTVTFNIADVAFDGPDCVKVPMTVNYTKTGAKPNLTRMTLTIALNQAGTESHISNTWSSPAYSPATQTGLTDTISVCPRNIKPDRGPLVVSGNLNTYGGAAGTEDAPVPNSTVNVAYNPTQMTKPRVKRVNDGVAWIYVTGDATASTLTKGTVPAGGTLTLQMKKPHHKAWVSGRTTAVDDYGQYKFSVPYAEKYPKGTQWRVALTDCGWCTSNLSRPTKG